MSCWRSLEYSLYCAEYMVDMTVEYEGTLQLGGQGEESREGLYTEGAEEKEEEEEGVEVVHEAEGRRLPSLE